MSISVIALASVAGLGAIGLAVSAGLEAKYKEPLYKILEKVCFMTFGIAGILMTMLMALGN